MPSWLHRPNAGHQAAESGMLTIEICPFASNEAAEIVQLWRQSFEHGVGIRDPNPLDSQLAYLLTEVAPHNQVRVVKQAGAIVAFMASTADCISQLYVRVDQIGQGIGARLVEIAKAESHGSLWLYTFAQNCRARRFYARHGFQEIARESQNMYRLEAIKYKWQRGKPAACARP
jgi:ribosomal protein S18 acetylase RimI-like enzyme